MENLNVQELINALNTLWESNEPYIEEDYESFWDNKGKEITPLIDNAELEACGALITSGGQCNWANIREVEKAGYYIYAGEKDSFGWLTGCIEKLGDDKKRILVYG